MITADRLSSIAIWSSGLEDHEFERAQRGIVEKCYSKGSYICHRDDNFEPWTGVISGLVKLSATSITGKAVTLAGIRTAGWFGEGSVLKNEPRKYDLVALRDTQLALMNRPTFVWLFENSTAFNRFLVQQINERLGQFIALVEYDRMLEAPARLARSIAWLFNPVLYPETGKTIEISQEELGLLSGLSRQAANSALRILVEAGLVTVAHGKLTVGSVDDLINFGE